MLSSGKPLGEENKCGCKSFPRKTNCLSTGLEYKLKIESRFIFWMMECDERLVFSESYASLYLLVVSSVLQIKVNGHGKRIYQ